MVSAICNEVFIQKDYLLNEEIETIYFGGGTPSLLSEEELNKILEAIYRNFTISSFSEITLETNPDDLSKEKLLCFKNAGVNRLSIGIQSFDENHLRYLNRTHNSLQAKSCVQQAQSLGFDNITIDLIYGIPTSTHIIWNNDLEIATKLSVPHISAYCLTIEPKTIFGNWLKKKKIKAINEDFATEQFDLLVNTFSQSDYEHYEVSNFAKKGYYSKHNTNYWKQKTYLGIGPGAHSFNGDFRQFNVSNNAKYIKEIVNDRLPCKTEELTKQNKINEYLMTSLRTQWGCDIKVLNEKGYFLLEEKKEALAGFERDYSLEIKNNIIYLTTKGKLLADTITANLFV